MSVSVAGAAALALALGLRHGLDADHLAAIDGLTRSNMVARRGFAPYCGALFSAGHGGLILVAAVAIAMLTAHWVPPAWLDAAGKVISAGVLLVLSACNLRLGLYGAADEVVRPVGLRSSLFSAALRSSRAWQVVLVGALFALSFDALGLATLFAANAAGLGGATVTAGIAFAFGAGMLAVDAVNGLLVARLAARTDRGSAAASRAMTLAVALASLGLGAAMALSVASASLDQWLNSHELGVSLFVCSAVLAGYLAARVASRRGAEPLPG